MEKFFLSVFPRFQNVSFAEYVSVGGALGLYQSFSLVIGCLLDLRKLGGIQASFQTEDLWKVFFQDSALMSLISDFLWSNLNTHTHTHTHTPFYCKLYAQKALECFWERHLYRRCFSPASWPPPSLQPLELGRTQRLLSRTWENCRIRW